MITATLLLSSCSKNKEEPVSWKPVKMTVCGGQELLEVTRSGLHGDTAGRWL
jgi:hypothetical protein